jgi:hypothetical protein
MPEKDLSAVPTEPPKKETYLVKSDLKDRGWSDGLIKTLLVAPDKTRTNPKYQSGPRTQLFALARVEIAEQSPEFISKRVDREKRQAAAQKGVETKKKKMDGYVRSVKIEVPRLEDSLLIKESCDHYNSNKKLKERNFTPATHSSEQSFLNRITVNYLRHQLTSYETHLDEIAGKVGTGDAYLEIKIKVLDAIADAYPHLRPECEAQKVRKKDVYEEW